MIEKDELYPLLFSPIYVNVVWGGNMLETTLGRKLPKTDIPIGEAWEVCDREDAQSIVENGPLAGKSLGELCAQYGKALLGDLFNGGRFPLLVKIIDAGKRLSLQVHPDENYCAKNPGAEPKTEMWYVIDAKPDAKIIAGLKYNCTMRQFIEKINSTDIENYLQIHNSVPGDAYYISAGRVHAIGGGNLLLEIQQNSNTTYRISDWGRLGSDGKPRELHIEQALSCINFMDRNTPRIPGVSDSAYHNRKLPIINMCPFFRVDELRLVGGYFDRTDGASFHLLTAINKNATVRSADKRRHAEIPRGRTALIPANFGTYSIEVPEGSETTVIKTTL
ncbi:MAG: type I phosphomannose isomerase catalytic subunit [Candidatus Nanoarchaeia archaeon]